MTEVPEELAPFVEMGFRVEEWGTEVYAQAPSQNSAVYLLAEEKPGGYSFGITYHGGLSSEQLASLAEEVRERVVSLLEDGPTGPYTWSPGVAVPGHYVWIALHDLDPWLGF